jgi:ribonuclease HI
VSVDNQKSVKITAYTDGSALGNPGPGGYGVILESGIYRKEFSQGFRCTTNNRMELLAVITALEALKYPQCRITIYTDSQYVVNAVEKKWLWGWEKKRFAGKKNADLWIRFLKIYPCHEVRLAWIKGHAGHPDNERCDRLAVAAAQGSCLFIDKGYMEGLTKKGE